MVRVMLDRGAVNAFLALHQTAETVVSQYWGRDEKAIDASKNVLRFCLYLRHALQIHNSCEYLSSHRKIRMINSSSFSF